MKENEKKQPLTIDDILDECKGVPAQNGDCLYYHEKLQMLLTGPLETDGVVILCRYFGRKKHVVIPDGVDIIENGALAFNFWMDSVVVPDSVEKIGDTAFMMCGPLSEIKLSKNLKRIGKNAFDGSAWHGVTINLPDSVKFIDDFAFDNCAVDKLPQNLQYIGAGAFCLCAFEKPNDGEYFEIPNKVTEIGNQAFMDAWLGDNCKGIWLPLSVKKIGKGAFRGTRCGDKWETTIYYEGSEEDWKAIEINNEGDWLKDIEVKFNCKPR